MQLDPRKAFLKTGSGAETPLKHQSIMLNLAHYISVPFWGKTKVIFSADLPLLPILPLCCFHFQLFLGIPEEEKISKMTMFRKLLVFYPN